jgi:hypothetical protein
MRPAQNAGQSFPWRTEADTKSRKRFLLETSKMQMMELAGIQLLGGRFAIVSIRSPSERTVCPEAEVSTAERRNCLAIAILSFHSGPFTALLLYPLASSLCARPPASRE